MDEPIAKTERLNGALELGEAPGRAGRLAENPYEWIGGWGRAGYDVGREPEWTWFTSDGPDGFGFGQNIEGDWREEIYSSREARDAAIDQQAFDLWKREGEKWVEGIETFDDLPAELRGSYGEPDVDI